MTGSDTHATIDAAMAAANVMLRIAARSVAEVEDRVNSAQLRVLMLIETSGPQAMVDVAAELDVHPSNATRLCNKLVNRGYITRTEHPADRRYVRLDLTRQGRELIEHVLMERRRAMAEVLENLTTADLDAVTQGLQTFAHAAGDVPSLDGRFTFGPS